MNKGKPIAFFDVDKTLCDCYSGFYTTIELMRRNIIKKRRILQALFYNTIGRLHINANVRRLYEIAVADMAGTHIDDILKIGRHTFDRHVKPTMFVEGMEEIEALRGQGYAVALLSSAPYMLIEIMQEFLRTDAAFSNGPVIENGILTRKVREPICYKEGKVQVARQYAEAQGLTLRDCKFYSDSISDLPLLSVVGHPVAVNPDYKLKREALRRRWPILQFRHRLGSRKP
ncbi:MAG TPA: hypothetical protein DF383_06345 [Deltaproteobacteria bacterium]|nr:hypothetical protein [Deltaproteobacteria bacterium]